MKVDWLIVGAGFTGAVLAERLASQLDQKVLIIDSREHIGGNAYDYLDADGVLVHKYGPHIFHTNSRKVWEYLSLFTGWHPYCHRTLAVIEDKQVPIPFNLNSLHSLFPAVHAERLEQLLIQQFGFGSRVPISKLLALARGDLRVLADYIYHRIFYQYSLKQWGLDPKDLHPSVMDRVPVSVSRDDRYFRDTYQAMPQRGYTELFRRMLVHRNIQILLGTDYRQIANGEVRFEKMIYTGAVDQFFDFSFGALPYRSLHFDFKHARQAQYQAAGIVNYPNDEPCTRITEFKHLTGQSIAGTTIAVEYPRPYWPGKNLPFYPIPRLQNQVIYNRYLNAVQSLNGSVLFAGRLADYRYYNMDQAVARALKVFDGIALQASGSFKIPASRSPFECASPDPPCEALTHGAGRGFLPAPLRCRPAALNISVPDPLAPLRD